MAKTSLIRIAIAAIAIGALPPGTALAQASQVAATVLPADHPAVKSASGAWIIAFPNGRQCRILLNPKAPRDNLIVGMPAECRNAMPAIGSAMVWGLNTEGNVLITTADGKPVANFTRGSSGPLTSPFGTGTATLTPASGRYPDPVRQGAQVAATTPPRAGSITPAVPAPPAEQLPGTYAVMRQPGREICRMVPDGKPAANAAAKPGQKLARFVGTCADTGFATFDPVAWRLSDGRLSLVARKGHEVALSYGADGVWQKDPPSGAALMLKRTTP